MTTPVLVDRSLLWALSIKYAIYCLWALSATFNGIRTVNQAGGDYFTFYWSISIFIVTLILAPLPPMGKVRAEMLLTVLLAGLIAVYPSTLVYRVIVEGDPNIQPLAILSFVFLVIPIWRILFLFRRLRKPRPRKARKSHE